MRYLKLAKKNKEFSPEAWDNFYGSEISRRIRKKYSVDKELSLLRQRDEKPEEFAEYYAFAEKCKLEVKEEMGL